MVIPDFFFSLVIASVLSVLFAAVLRRRVPRSGFFWFFLLVFLATWAGGVWVRPFGPTLLGVYWLPLLLVGLFFTLLFTFFILQQGPAEPTLRLNRREILDRRETLDLLEDLDQEKQASQVAYFSLSLFFWLVLLALIVAIILRYGLGG